VSEPDIRSAGEAVRYAKKYREILVYLGVCDGNMNEGSLRVDANISVRPLGQAKLGTRSEIKNVNSFRFLEQAILYERDRQIELIQDGGTVVQETRLFDPERGITVSMRSKEEAHDYRYFPDPDLLPLVIEDAWVEEARKSLPELPEAKRKRYAESLGLSAQNVAVLTQEPETAKYFEEALAALPKADEARHAANVRGLANWIAGPIAAKVNEGGLESIRSAPITPANLAGMQAMIGEGKLSNNVAKTTVIDEMWATGKSAGEIVAEKGLAQSGDTSEIEAIVDQVLAECPSEAESYKGGNAKVLGFLVGQIMRKSRGKANPALVNELLAKKLGV
jgi:aspartyl-tRNA(Asn)/glutamyl-tRNA(Gln) amidotransferase subunit B